MKAFHGTGRQFDHFDPEQIMSGEGLAKRGWGFNVALDRTTAAHFADCSAGPTAYVAELVVPNLDQLLLLDAGLAEALPEVGHLGSLIRSYYQTCAGVDIDDFFEQAAEHEDVPLGASQDRAEDMFERLLWNSGDLEAEEELEDFSPGYDWAPFMALIDKHSLGLSPDEDTGEQLLAGLTAELGAQRAAEFLLSQDIYGTIGKEVFGKLGQAALDDFPTTRSELQALIDASGDTGVALSAVVFRGEDIKILGWSEQPKAAPPTWENEDSGMSP